MTESDAACPKLLILVIGGVAGSGKTTLALALDDEAHRRGVGHVTRWDADDFLSAANRRQIKQGVGLSDADRAPWLANLANLLSAWVCSQTPDRQALALLACSVLRRAYRQQLREAVLQASVGKRVTLRFILLQGPTSVLQDRLHQREVEGTHFAHLSILASQLDTWQVADPTEEPDAFVLEIIDPDDHHERSSRELIELVRLKLAPKNLLPGP